MEKQHYLHIQKCKKRTYTCKIKKDMSTLVVLKINVLLYLYHCTLSKKSLKVHYHHLP